MGILDGIFGQDTSQSSTPSSGSNDIGSSILNFITNTVGSTVSNVIKPSSDTKPDSPVGSSTGVTNQATLDNLVKTGAYVADQMKGAVGSIAGLQAKNDAGTDAAVAAVGKASKDQQVVTTAEQNAAIQTKIDNVRDASAAGTQPGVASFITDKVLSNMRDKASDISDLGNKIEGMKNTSVLDDPVSWLVNQFKIPFAQDNLDQKQQDFNENATNLGALQKATSDAGIRNAANNVAANEAVLKAKVDLDAQTAIVQQQKLRESSIQTDTNLINSGLAANRDQLNAMYTINSAMAQQQSLAIEQGKLTLGQENFDSEAPIRQFRAMSLSDAIADKEQTDKMLGNLSEVGVPGINAAQYRGMSSAEKASVENLAVAVNASKEKGLPVQAGLDPYKAIQNLTGIVRAPDLGLDLTIKKLNNIGLGVEQNVSDTMGKTGQSFAKLDPTTKSTIMGRGIYDTATKELNNIPLENGVYSPPSIGQVMKLPAIANSPLGQLLQPVANINPDAPLKPEDVARAAMTLAAKIGTGPASSLATDLYHNIQLNNNSVNKYNMVALGMMDPSTTGFKQNVFGKVVDQTNPASYENMLKRQMTLLKTQEITGGSNSLLFHQ